VLPSVYSEDFTHYSSMSLVVSRGYWIFNIRVMNLHFLRQLLDKEVALIVLWLVVMGFEKFVANMHNIIAGTVTPWGDIV